MKLAELAYNLKWFFPGLLDKPLKALEKLWAQKKVRMIVVCSVVLIIAVPLAIVVSARIILSADGKKNMMGDVFSFDQIAPEDFFIPEEPDFLPPVMLEQEQKKTWSVEDAAEFWTPPSQFPREFWLEEVSNSIDRLLEPLP
ncbi:MAG: hypothetical protein LBD44_05960 [Spirochaetaceae bacterium]|jgi:hypothetical protein|nr:hypothetical protein [Spirochaetaceae bacterium]